MGWLSNQEKITFEHAKVHDAIKHEKNSLHVWSGPANYVHSDVDGRALVKSTSSKFGDIKVISDRIALEDERVIDISGEGARVGHSYEKEKKDWHDFVDLDAIDNTKGKSREEIENEMFEKNKTLNKRYKNQMGKEFEQVTEDRHDIIPYGKPAAYIPVIPDGLNLQLKHPNLDGDVAFASALRAQAFTGLWTEAENQFKQVAWKDFNEHFEIVDEWFLDNEKLMTPDYRGIEKRAELKRDQNLLQEKIERHDKKLLTVDDYHDMAACLEVVLSPQKFDPNGAVKWTDKCREGLAVLQDQLEELRHAHTAWPDRCVELPVFEADCSHPCFHDEAAKKLKERWLATRKFKHVAIVDLNRAQNMKPGMSANQAFCDAVDQWVRLMISHQQQEYF